MMEYETFLNIADITIRIKSEKNPEKENEKISYRYKNFILNRSPGKIDIDLTLKIKPDFTRFNPEIIFETRREPVKINKRRRKKILIENKIQKKKEKYLGKGLEWRMGKVGKRILLEGGSSGGYQVLLNKDLKKGEIFIINPEINNWEISDICHGFLQILLIHYLAKYKLGIIIHSAGIKDGKNGYLFAGKSRAGKSTTSRIWDKNAKIQVLNDDRVIIRKENNRFFTYPTPWHGDFSDYLKISLGKAELKSLFFIYHSKKNIAEKLSLKDNFNLFFQAVFPSFLDKDCLQSTSEILLDIILSVPCYKFGFKNDKRIIGYVRNLTADERHR